ncbi:efflux RND transporter periplasmic adaptor subunit [Desulfovibrio inopinatus]|uniref:efflux RND transporter periplasmic adaptor subunit n=1 Tax=Desulfovibrio inopinatus TaxID=102109 RepID=UPI000406427D|nr:efflux RND transporter periplasmic adaptor subunit [Desulfovibrio inopinatus]
MKRRTKFIAVTCIILLAALTYWKQSASIGAVQYLVVHPKLGQIEQSVITTGEIVAADLVLVGAQVSGQIKKMHVVLGQYVHKGELIAEIDSAPQLNELKMTKASLQMHQAQLAVKQVNVREAKQDLRRQSQLKRKGVLAQSDLDKSQNALDLAEAEEKELAALVEKTQIELDKTKTDLSYTRIVAPIDGTVVSIPVKAGQTVNSSQTAPTIVQLADLNKLELKMSISEGDITKIHPGMAVRFSILSEPEKEYVENVASIDPGPIRLSSARNDDEKSEKEPVYYYGRVKINNADNTLHIGMTAQCSITVESVDSVVTIPRDAIHTQGNIVSVLTEKENGVVTTTPIVTGLQDNINVEVISGLTVTDTVVLSQMDNQEIMNSIASMR